MKPELWARVRDVFERSLDTDDGEAFLCRECGDDVELLSAVRAMRRADAATDAVPLEPPDWGTVERGTWMQWAPGDRVGALELMSERRREVMGAVHEARHLEP